jgi:hypothetical protein
MSGVGGLDDSDYVDPSVKTFAWWQAASRSNDGEDADFEPGLVISECSLPSSQEEGVVGCASLVPAKRAANMEDMEGPLTAVLGGRKRLKAEGLCDRDADSLFGQWL